MAQKNITNLPKAVVFGSIEGMKSFYGKTFLRLVKDPGFLLAVSNALFFLNKSLLAFLVVMTAIVSIIALKSYACAEPPQHPYLQLLYRMGQKKFIGLEMIGYACLTVAFIAMTRQLFIEFVSSFCFGLANLLMSFRYTPNTMTSQQDWDVVLQNVRKNQSLTPFFLAILQEPIILICIGYLHAGLAAGNEALWILPIICVVPYITIKKPNINRAITQGALCFCAIWFTFIALSHHIWILALSNILCTFAYIEITYQEHKLFLSKQNR